MNKKKSLKFRTPGVEGWEIKESPRKNNNTSFYLQGGRGVARVLSFTLDLSLFEANGVSQ